METIDETVRLPDAERFATLVAVVETGSFRQAADVRFLTPSAVHKQMRSLERQLGIALFARSGRDIVVLPIARELAASAADALDASARLAHHLTTVRTRATKSLHVVSPTIHLARSIGVAVRRFESERDVQVETTVRPASYFVDGTKATTALKRHECDVVITTLDLDGCVATKLWPTSLVAVTPPSHHSSTCTITDLAGATVFAQDSYVWSRRTLESLAAEAGIELNIVTESIPEVCVSLAQADMGFAVVADDNLAAADTAVPLLDVRDTQPLGWVKAHSNPQPRSPLTQDFVSFLAGWSDLVEGGLERGRRVG